jgi:hypothetical protein
VRSPDTPSMPGKGEREGREGAKEAATRREVGEGEAPAEPHRRSRNRRLGRSLALPSAFAPSRPSRSPFSLGTLDGDVFELNQYPPDFEGHRQSPVGPSATPAGKTRQTDLHPRLIILAPARRFPSSPHN